MQGTLSRFSALWSQGKYRDAFREIVVFLFAVDSIGSIFTRAIIWFVIAAVIIVSMDTFSKNREPAANLKSNLGFFLLFLIVGGALLYLLFGFAPFLTTVNAQTAPN